ncbi:MAG: (R)-hydratase [Gammaproteobacteria bacterium]|jgi:3-hydroxybutyryl-CoA dehydratase|nr:(R)-hydratase [Gammaproteobacteria bacterium]|tara:strand:+ start:45 stop:506 length:462 start_codon:yes stop_codon:yes gene_type:complete
MEAEKLQNIHPVTFFEDLREGMSAEYTRLVTQQEIEMFAELTGDKNPIHLDPSFAEKSIFKTRIAHGMLIGSFISTVIGTRMPGPGCIYLSQSLNFMSPARAGEKVTAMAQVMELHPKKYRATFKTVCKVNTRILLDGTALIQVPSRKLHAEK